MNETINLAAVSATASAWYAAVPFRIVMIVVALLLCFAGYKLMRGVSGLFGLSCGFAAGAVLTALLPLPDTVWIELTVSVIIMVILGIVLGALLYRFYRTGFFLLSAAAGAAIGYVPAMFVWDTSQTAAYAVMIVFAVIFGVAGAVIDKPAVIVLTSFFGFAAAMPLLDLLQQNMTLQLGAGAVVTVLGMLVQFLTNRGDSKPLGTKKLIEQETETELEEEEAAPPRMPQEAVDPEDEIDSISDVVAANIGMTEPPMANPFEYTKPADEPEQVSDSTQIIDLSKHEGETKTSVFSGESIETVQLEDTTEEDEFAITLAGLKTVPAKENEEIELQETRVDIPKTAEESEQSEESEAQPEETQVAEQPKETAEPTEIAEPVEAEQLAEAEEQPEQAAEEQTETAEAQSEDAEESTRIIDLAEKSKPKEQPEEDVVSQDTVVRPLTENEEAAESEVQQAETVEPAEEENEEAEDMQEETEEESKKKRRFTLRLLLPILLLAASVVFASLHMQMPEITFLLIFLCYVLKYYRITAFACLILCVRSGLDVYIQYLQSGVQDAAVNAVSAVVFLIIGIICVWASAAQKKDE